MVVVMAPAEATLLPGRTRPLTEVAARVAAAREKRMLAVVGKLEVKKWKLCKEKQGSCEAKKVGEVKSGTGKVKKR
jgi:hypothetical protein